LKYVEWLRVNSGIDRWLRKLMKIHGSNYEKIADAIISNPSMSHREKTYTVRRLIELVIEECSREVENA